MDIAKIIIDNNAELDLTQDTVTSNSLLNGFTAHDANGDPIVGTAETGRID